MRMTSPSGPRRAEVLRLTLAAALAVALVGCASGPASTGASRGRDGPPKDPPKGLLQVPDAEPQVEALRTGGPNKPYEVLGRRYTPFTHDRPFVQQGLASWYGAKFHGRPTASGERYDMYAMSAAHPTMPLPSYARVRNPANGREVVVRVNDRGPFHPGRIIDLSYTAALKLDLLRGVAPVEVERITHDAIRVGSWRRGNEAPRTVAAETAPASAAMPSFDEPGPPRLPTQADEPEVALVAPQAGFWIQLGAFRQRDGAEDFLRQVAAELDWLSGRLAVIRDAALFRLQAGPFSSQEEATGTAARIRSELQLVPVVLERH